MFIPIFTDILAGLKEKKVMLDKVDPSKLDDTARVAALNYLFSSNTTAFRYGDYRFSFGNIVKSFVNSIADMRSVVKVQQIKNDP